MNAKRQFLELCAALGVEASLTRKGRHYVWRVSKGGIVRTIVSPVSPSDTRWAMNKKAQLKKLLGVSDANDK